MNTRARRWAIGGGAVLAALAILWESGSYALSASAPETAVSLRPGLAEAQANAARLSLAQAVAKQNGPAALRAARQAGNALLASPVTGGALGLWMQGQFMGGQRERVAALEPVSNRISYRDAAASLALTLIHAENNDAKKAMDRIDNLMRTTPETRLALTPVLAKLTASPDVVGHLVATLTANPPWRTRFLEAMGGDRSNTEGAWSVLEGLAATKSPPSEDELTPWFIANGRTIAAADLRQRWMRFFGKRGSNASATVIDGGFEGKSGAPPIGWYRANSEGTATEFREVPGFGRGASLYATHLGTDDSLLAEQLVFLTPGSWSFTFTRGSDLAVDGQSLRLALLCHEGGRTLDSKDVPVTSETTGTRVTLSVPAGCAAQSLQLIALKNASQTTVSFMIDDFAAAPAGGAR